jgi:N-acetylglucosamine-6-phosphate deacetylase
MLKFFARRLGDFQPVEISIENGRYTQVSPKELSADDAIALPFVGAGLFDIQLNGYGGEWFCSESLTVEAVERIIHAYVASGITRCFPTLITSSHDAMTHGIRMIRRAVEQSSLVRSVICGIHLEGPFISPMDGPRGAHPLEHVRAANIAEFEKWQQAADNTIRLVTLAPEVPGAMSLIRHLSQTGVIASIGHTAASPEIIAEAAAHGATLSTHLGNGCSANINRHTNVFWPQLADDRLTASIISDGWHVPADMLRCILRCKTLNRVIVTSDISGFGGCPAGTYNSGGVSVEILEDRRIVVAGQRQFLAGSASTTGDCVAHLVNTCGLSLEDAWRTASETPSEFFGLAPCVPVPGQEATCTLFRLPDGQCTESDRSKLSTSDNRRDYEPVAAVIRGQLVSGRL